MVIGKLPKRDTPAPKQVKNPAMSKLNLKLALEVVSLRMRRIVRRNAGKSQKALPTRHNASVVDEIAFSLTTSHPSNAYGCRALL
jgi:hypothetical protein